MSLQLMTISSWWQTLPGFDKIFWSIALIFSFLFLVQTIFSFAAGDGDTAYGDADLATESDHGIGYGFLTIKNFIAFFTIFGWTGVALSGSDLPKIAVIGLAFVGGCAIVAMMVVLMRSMSKLKQSGTLQIENAVGKTATVYLRIPAARQGTGKITINLQGTQREMSAVTDDPADISTGSFVMVKEVLGDNILAVSIV